MSVDEIKTCPRCTQNFECKAGDISQCHCQEVLLSRECRLVLQQQYAGCLCNRCLREISDRPGPGGGTAIELQIALE